MNKNLVFKGESSYSVLKYYILVLFILAANYGLLYLLSAIMRMPLVLAKLITELALFFVSFTVQKKYIFKHSVTSKQTS